MDKIKEFIAELRLRWDDSYWWADHQWLVYLLLLSFAAMYTLGTEYMKLSMRNKMMAGGIIND